MKKSHLVDINLSGNELNNAIIPGYGYSDRSISTSDGLNLVKGKFILNLSSQTTTKIRYELYPAIPYNEVGIFDLNKYKVILEMYDRGRWRIAEICGYNVVINGNVFEGLVGSSNLPQASLITHYLNVEGTWNAEKHKYNYYQTAVDRIPGMMLRCIHPTNDDTHILFTKYFRFSFVVFLGGAELYMKFHRSFSSPEFRYIYTADVDPATHHVNNSKAFLAKRKGFTRGIY